MLNHRSSNSHSSVPSRRHPSIAAHIGSDARSMEQSLTLMDIMDGPPEDLKKGQKYYEHSQVFEELVETTEKEYAVRLRPSGLHRQSSVSPVRALNGSDVAKSAKAVRRHSSFESRQTPKAYDEHKAMKEYLGKPKRTTHKFEVIQQMLDFNLSASMSSLNDLSMMNKSLGLHYSCPVLSYMNEDEEDSVELTYIKKRQSRRSSLCSLTEDEAESWESLNDVASNSSIEGSADYHISIKLMDEDDDKPRAKRQRSRTCLVLSHQLEDGQHPQKIFRSLMSQAL